MSKLYKGTERTIEYFLLVFCLVIGAQTFLKMAENQIASPSDKGVFLLCAILFVLFLLCIISYAFKFIDSISEKVQIRITIVCFILLFAARMAFVLRYPVIPVTDSYDDMEVAYYLMSHNEVTSENYHAFFMEIFGNNYFFVYFTYVFFRILSVFGISDYTTACYILNVVCITMAEVLLWLSVKKVYSISKANKVLVLLLLNPVFTLFVYWYYTCTVSLCFASLLLYLCVQLYYSSSLKKEIPLAILIGILTVLSFKLRPTAVFIMIAAALIVFGNKLFGVKKMATCGLACFASMLVVFFSFSGWEKSHFGQITDKNFPISYWIALGSYGDGSIGTNHDNWDLLMEMEDTNERKDWIKQSIKENYQTMGFSGILSLWNQKSVMTWGDGYSNANIKMRRGQLRGRFYDLVVGNKSDLLRIYAQAYRFVLFFGLLLLLMSKKKRNRFTQWFLITLFGGILFYCFWEAKGFYSIPFLPYMIFLASEGFEEKIDPLLNKTILGNREKTMVYSLVVVFVCANLFPVLTQTRQVETEKLYAAFIRAEVPVVDLMESSDEEILQQQFHIDGKFNKLGLFVNDTSENASNYAFSIQDKDKNVLYCTTIKPKMINEKNQIRLTFPDISGKGDYYLQLKKLDVHKESILFLTQQNYYFNLYDGELIANNKKMPSNELFLDVRYQTESVYFSKRTAALVVLMLAVIWLLPFCALQYGTRKEKGVK